MFLFWCQSRYAAIGRTLLVRILPSQTESGDLPARSPALGASQKHDEHKHAKPTTSTVDSRRSHIEGSVPSLNW